MKLQDLHAAFKECLGLHALLVDYMQFSAEDVWFVAPLKHPDKPGRWIGLQLNKEVPLARIAVAPWPAAFDRESIVPAWAAACELWNASSQDERDEVWHASWACTNALAIAAAVGARKLGLVP
jgi:hypothetical protein